MPKLKLGNVFFVEMRIIATIRVNSRREISIKGKYCFKCLNPGHIKKNYKAKVKWNYCQAEGSHHTALCFSENGTLNTIDSKNNHPNTLNNTE